MFMIILRINPGRRWVLLVILMLAALFVATAANASTTNYSVRGVVKEIKSAERQLVIAHESIPDFMEAMTMPFNLKDETILTNFAAGQKITFQLHVTETESWVDDIKQTDSIASEA